MVTEKQKEIIICFMQDHPEFGRGRLRYNSENKRKIDELWEKLSTILNTAACGPYKSAKEWSKTWRDWKSNTLKKVAKHKTYMMSTGGGSSKHLQLTGIEKALIDFLTPDASGLTGIPEGGIEDIMSSSSYNELSVLSYNIELEETQEMSLNEISEMDLYQMQSCTLQKKHAQLENNKKIWEHHETRAFSKHLINKQNIQKM
ncbi:uncharacterized protein LOC109861525 [Pseudomyrmex gracilis]|uniref:uncharacterized protein LOC109861525 n=1 Tax=Pseudomyrmex gracilis TaxID=219809 RepID=UPI000994A9DA|nr:uncharacterized protein LOC109861525 [Pseudomyrmex gracilis]